MFYKVQVKKCDLYITLRLVPLDTMLEAGENLLWMKMENLCMETYLVHRVQISR